MRIGRSQGEPTRASGSIRAELYGGVLYAMLSGRFVGLAGEVATLSNKSGATLDSDWLSMLRCTKF